MQVMIDIPEETLESIKLGMHHRDDVAYIMDQIENNSTVLPTKHGDLIDRDKLEPDCEEQELHDGEDWRNEYCGVSLMQLQYYAEVIIPATKEKNK